MAVDWKTGKPVADIVTLPDGYGVADYLADLGVVGEADVRAFVGGVPPSPPPPAEPRGVSLPHGAYGPWLAAREMRKGMEGWP